MRKNILLGTYIITRRKQGVGSPEKRDPYLVQFVVALYKGFYTIRFNLNYYKNRDFKTQSPDGVHNEDRTYDRFLMTDNEWFCCVDWGHITCYRSGERACPGVSECRFSCRIGYGYRYFII